MLRNEFTEIKGRVLYKDGDFEFKLPSDEDGEVVKARDVLKMRKQEYLKAAEHDAKIKKAFGKIKKYMLQLEKDQALPPDVIASVFQSMETLWERSNNISDLYSNRVEDWWGRVEYNRRHINAIAALQRLIRKRYESQGTRTYGGERMYIRNRDKEYNATLNETLYPKVDPKTTVIRKLSQRDTIDR